MADAEHEALCNRVNWTLARQKDGGEFVTQNPLLAPELLISRSPKADVPAAGHQNREGILIRGSCFERGTQNKTNSMKKVLASLLVAIVATINVSAQGSFTALWDETGASDGVTGAGAGGITLGAFTRGAGLTSNAGGTFNSTGYSTGTTSLATAITDNDYISFTISIPALTSFSFSTMSIRLDRSNTGPGNFAILSSDTGFTSSDSLWGGTALNTAGANFLNQGISSVSGVTAGAPQVLEFRIYAWGSTGGTFDIENLTSGAITTSAVVLNGTITAIPEPHEYALGFGLMLVALVAIRRRKAMQA